MVICAAIKLKITETNKDDKFLIIPCHRHSQGFQIIQEFRNINDNPNRAFIAVEQGFIISNGEFRDRKAALKHAKNCGQLSISTLYNKEQRLCGKNELYSGDLY